MGNKYMTVRELYDACEWYAAQDDHSWDDRVLIVDDGMKPKSFDVSSAMGIVHDREVKSAKIVEQTIPITDQITGEVKPLPVLCQAEAPEYARELVLGLITNLCEEAK